MGANRDLTSAFGQAPKNTTSPYSVLDGLYALHEELGSGGFGKVGIHHVLVKQCNFKM